MNPDVWESNHVFFSEWNILEGLNGTNKKVINTKIGYNILVGNVVKIRYWWCRSHRVLLFSVDAGIVLSLMYTA